MAHKGLLALGDTVLEQLETKAREAQKWLRADPHPATPWLWRKAVSSHAI